jgi:hypothetical protein
MLVGNLVLHNPSDPTHVRVRHIEIILPDPAYAVPIAHDRRVHRLAEIGTHGGVQQMRELRINNDARDGHEERVVRV